MATVSTKTQEMVADLPHFYDGEPYTLAVLRAVGAEVERLIAQGAEMRRTAFPSQATDTYGFLSVWERVLGLPVGRSDVSEVARRDAVLAQLRNRTASAATDWITGITLALGSENWSHTEAACVVTLQLPGGHPNPAFEDLAQKITPAHLQLVFIYGEGFIVGESQVGIDQL